MNRRIFITTGLILILVVGGFFGYRQFTASAQPDVSALQTVPVRRGDLVASISTAGTIAVPQSATLVWSTTGIAGAVYVGVGDTVRADDVLMRLAPASVPQNVILAQADLIAARQALHDLQNPTQLQIIETRQAVADAEQALHDLLNPTQLQLAQAEQDVADAEEALEDHNASVAQDAASVQNDIAQFQAQLEEAQRRLEVVAQPDVQYYQARAKAAENRLLQLELESEIIRIGSLTDAVDRARDFLEDEEEFLQKVKDASEGCKVAVESGDHTKLAFAGELTYRHETYGAGGIYDVPNWIADELLANYSEIVSEASLTCDPERQLTVDGRTTTLSKAQDAYNDVVTQLLEAERKLKQEQLANQQTIQDTQEDLEKANRNLAWAYSGKYSKQAIQAAETQSAGDLTRPESIEAATLQAEVEIALAAANLVDAQAQLEDLLDGPDSEDVALAEATLADAQEELAKLLNPDPDDVAVAEVTLADAKEKLADLLAGPDPDDTAAAEAKVLAAQTTLDSVRVVAPFDSTVVETQSQVGDYVSNNTIAVTLADLSYLEVQVNVSELDINSIFVGQEAKLTLDATPGQTFAGRVADVGFLGSVDQGVVTFPVTVLVDDPEPALKPGMTAAVSIVTERREDVLVVPNRAVRVSGGQRTVTVLWEGQQIAVPVTLGLLSETMSEVIEGELREGDAVVINQPTTTQGGFGGGRGGFRGGFGGFGGGQH